MEEFKLDEFEFHGITTPIDLDYLYEDGMTFEELEERVYQLISEEEVIGYYKALRILYTFDWSLNESMGLADEMGLELKGLNSEVLATLLYQEKLRKEWELNRDDIGYEVDKLKSSKK